MSVTVAVFEDYDRMSIRVAQLFARHLLKRPDTTLGFATGETPKRFYKRLIELHDRGLIDFQQMTAFNLDEYYPIDPEHPKRFERYMNQHLYDNVNVDPGCVHIPDGTTDHPEREARRYEERIHAEDGIDLQLLGIGENGHIGFNEPGSHWDSETRVVSLASRTRERYANQSEHVPDQAITMGIKTIMQSKRIVLMSSGTRKAEIVSRALEGPVTREVPASILQLHPNLQVCLDRDAASQFDESYKEDQERLERTGEELDGSLS